MPTESPSSLPFVVLEDPEDLGVASLHLFRSEIDGAAVVQIDTVGEPDEAPGFRVFLNGAVVYGSVPLEERASFGLLTGVGFAIAVGILLAQVYLWASGISA